MRARRPIATARISTVRTCSKSGYEIPGKVDSGWLNRLLAGLPQGAKVAPACRGETLGLAVGANAPLVIRGPAPVLGWAPAALPPADDDLALRLMDLYTHRDPVLAHALGEGIATGKIAAGMDVKPRGGPGDPNGMMQLASGAAKLLAQADGPRVAALAFEGWDTHAQEIGRLVAPARRARRSARDLRAGARPRLEGHGGPGRHGIRPHRARQRHRRNRSRNGHGGLSSPAAPSRAAA